MGARGRLYTRLFVTMFPGNLVAGLTASTIAAPFREGPRGNAALHLSCLVVMTASGSSEVGSLIVVTSTRFGATPLLEVVRVVVANRVDGVRRGRAQAADRPELFRRPRSSSVAAPLSLSTASVPGPPSPVVLLPLAIAFAVGRAAVVPELGQALLGLEVVRVDVQLPVGSAADAAPVDPVVAAGAAAGALAPLEVVIVAGAEAVVLRVVAGVAPPAGPGR